MPVMWILRSGMAKTRENRTEVALKITTHRYSGLWNGTARCKNLAEIQASVAYDRATRIQEGINGRATHGNPRGDHSPGH